MGLLRRGLPGFVARYLARLRFPVLFGITVVVFLADLVVPDAIPLVDELLLAFASAALGSLRKRVSDADQPGGGHPGGEPSPTGSGGDSTSAASGDSEASESSTV